MKKIRRKLAAPNNFIWDLFLLGGIFLCLLNPNATKADAADHVVINEVFINNYGGIGSVDDDWVELYNPTSEAVVLDGWSIQKTSVSGGSLVKQTLSGTIAANSYFLIVRDAASTLPALIDMADFIASTSFSLASNNIIYLVNNNVSITPSATTSNIIDYVGFGTANYYEGAAAAPSIAETKSIARIPAGEDTDNNSIDFILQNTPTPQNNDSGANGDDIGGTVLITVTPDANPAQNITANSADIVFQVNTAGSAKINYGITTAYGSSTAVEAVSKNTTKIISITDLSCGQTYHYSIYAENNGATESDTTVDATFITLPCGIKIDSLTMAKSSAKANNNFIDGWQWEWNITVWNTSEMILKMKFNEWQGSDSLAAGGNMQFSVTNGSTWLNITDNGAYPTIGADISSIDNSADAGRQVKILVQMKVPVGTGTGYYNSNYGILTE